MDKLQLLYYWLRSAGWPYDPISNIIRSTIKLLRMRLDERSH